MARFNGLKLLAILALSTLCAFMAGPALSATLDTTTRNVLHDALVLATANYNIAGAEAKIIAPDGEVWYGHSGYADYATGTIFTPDTTCGIGSTTKTFTSTVILQLVDEGKLTLNATIEDVLPGLLSVGDQVTIENLLHMRSGLNHYENTSEFVNQMDADPNYDWSMTELSELSDGLKDTPGTIYDYNNVNYMILGLMIENKEGGTWYEAVQTRLLAPLGLGSTGVMLSQSRPDMEPSAAGYALENGVLIEATDAFSPSIAQASGSIYSTVDDLATWLEAFQNGGLLSPQLQAQRFEGVPVGDDRPGLGFGMGVAVAPEHDAYFFSGNYNDVYTSQWMRRGDWDFLVLTNGTTGSWQGTDSSASGLYSVLVKALGL